MHKLYHLFYQDHVYMAQNGSDGKPLTGNGPDWGHAVSKDFTTWTHLREAIWNTEWCKSAVLVAACTRARSC